MTTFGTARWDRRIRIEVSGDDGAGRAFEQLDCTFTVRQTDAPEPDKAEITLYNLSADSAAFVAQAAVPRRKQGLRRVRIFAGHGGVWGDHLPLLFDGDLIGATDHWLGTDRITRLEAAEAARAWADTRIAETFRPPVTAHGLLQRLAASMGVGLDIGPGVPNATWAGAYTAKGPARTAVAEVCRTLDALWTLRKGTLVITARGHATTEEAVLLSPDAGLLDAPQLNTAQGTVSFTALLDARLAPRRRTRLESRRFSGTVILKTTTHKGGTENEFTTLCEGLVEA